MTAVYIGLGVIGGAAVTLGLVGYIWGKVYKW